LGDQPLLSAFEGESGHRGPILNVVDSFVQYLPDQSTEAMSDCPDGFCITQANGQTLENDLEVAVSLAHGGMGELV